MALMFSTEMFKNPVTLILFAIAIIIMVILLTQGKEVLQNLLVDL